ncbi:hypothetical protein [Geosporobacter ferrireducens]|uniref:hypothetical protein n=1 Tax=Geosporobacter ferrireducens TaxID=1424294 RepID=UPI0012EA66E4|nr:hypothetical protein [Geosporobacter ferrireducens]
MKKEYYEKKLQSPIGMDTIEEIKKIHEFDQLAITGNIIDGTAHKGLEHIR